MGCFSQPAGGRAERARCPVQPRARMACKEPCTRTVRGWRQSARSFLNRGAIDGPDRLLRFCSEIVKNPLHEVSRFPYRQISVRMI